MALRALIRSPIRSVLSGVLAGQAGGAAAAVLPTTNLVGEWRFDQGSGSIVHNDAAGTRPASWPNMVRMPENHFANDSGTSWSKASVTVTDAFAASPDGDTTATRIVFAAVSAGNAYIVDNDIRPTAAQHTASCWVKSNTGGTQTFRFNYTGGQLSANQTATTSWQRFTDVATLGTSRRVGIGNDTSGNAADILIWGLQLELGGSATTYQRPAGHLFPYKPATPPTWVSGGTRHGGDGATQAWVGNFLTALSLSAGSFHVVSKQLNTTAGGESSIYQPQLQVGSILGSTGQLYSQYNDHEVRFTINGTTAADDSGGAHTNSLVALSPYAGTPHLLSFVWGGGTGKVYVDGLLIRSTTFSPAATTHDLFSLFGALGFRYFNGEGYYAAWYSAAQDAATVAQVHAYILSALTTRGVTFQATATHGPNSIVVFEGDSLTNAAATVGYASYALPTLTPIPVGIKAAVIGDFITHASSRAVKVDALYDAGRQNNVLFCLFGANDLSTTSLVATVFAAFKAYGQARRAAGWKVVWATVLPTTRTGNVAEGGFNVQRAALNTLMRNDTSWYDALADFGADATVGVDAAASNATYYPDGTHPSLLTQSILGPIAATAIQSVLV